jgi:hypothetical protein
MSRGKPKHLRVVELKAVLDRSVRKCDEVTGRIIFVRLEYAEHSEEVSLLLQHGIRNQDRGRRHPQQAE